MYYGQDKNNKAAEKGTQKLSDSIKAVRRKSIRITLIYFLFGCTWIVLSDLIVENTIPDQISVMTISIVKGIFYVLSSALLIYLLVYPSFIKVVKSKDDIKKINADLEIEHNKAQTYLDSARVIFLAFDREMNVTLINNEGSEILGLNKEYIMGKNWINNFVPEQNRSELWEAVIKLFEGGSEDYKNHDNAIITASGEERFISWRNAILRSESGEVTGMLSSGIDITDQNMALAALRESERSKSVLISHIPGIAYRCKYDREWTMEFISDGCYTLTGYTFEDLILNEKLSYNDLICEEYRQEVWDDWARVVEQKSSYRGEYEILTASGNKKWVVEMGQPVYNDMGEVVALEGIVIDISESKQRYTQIQYMNDHDYLTGIYNRRYFEEKRLQMDTEKNLPLLIIIADISGVRLINDAFGHAEGDKLIIKTAEIIKNCCPENAVLARTGGDEFHILLPNAGREEASAIIAAINQLCKEYNLCIDDKSKSINVSLGYGIKDRFDKSITETEKEAEDNMYRRKLFDRESHHNAIIKSVMATMYARSQETEEHARRLAKLSLMIGEQICLPQKSMDDLQLLAMLHDIGKIGIGDNILNKPGKLSKDEWDKMKKHPEIGFRIAMSSSEFESVAEYILHHHERWDGGGYPGGISGEDIPLLSRILAITDAYDAMTEDRVYRKAMTQEEAIDEIRQNAGSQFDPRLAEIFINNLLYMECSEVQQNG